MAGVRAATKDYVDQPDPDDILHGNRVAGSSKADTDPVRNYSLRAVAALFGLGLSVMGRKFGVTADGESDASAGVTAAIAALPAWGTLVFPAGAYKLLDVVPSKPMFVRFDPGTTLVLPEGASNGASCFTVGSDDVQFFLMGTAQGDETTAAGTAQRFILSQGFDRVKLYGVGRMGRLTGFSGRAADFYDGDDLELAELRADGNGEEALYIQQSVAGTMLRPKIRDSVVDGFIAIEVNHASGIVDHWDILDNHVTAPGTDQPPIEAWSTAVDGLRNGIMGRNHAVGAGAGTIGQSIARGLRCFIVDSVTRNAAICAEIADGRHSGVVGGSGDCAGIASSVGAILDNSFEDGGRCFVRNFTAVDFKLAGVRVIAQSGQVATNQAVTGCTLETSYDSALGVAGAGDVRGLTVEGNTIVLPGADCFGVNADITSGFKAGAGNDISIGEGGTAYWIPEVAGAIAGRDRIESLHTAGVIGYAVYNTTDFNVGAGSLLEGEFDHGGQLINDNDSCDRGEIGGWTGAAGIQIVEQNGGTVGTDIAVRPIVGWGPGGVIFRAGFRVTGAAEAEYLYTEGIVTTAPTTAWPGSAPVPGVNGSQLTHQGGNVFSLKSGTWTAVN